MVGHDQLADLGVTDRAIQHRLACGRLYPVHRGVYAVGGRRLTVAGRRRAALLALGPAAVLSHRAAADVWGLRLSEGVDVTVPGKRRAPTGAVVHRSTLPADEVTTRAGFPVTTVSRTILDLAAIRPLREVRKAADEAERLRLGDTLSLADVVARYPGRRGVRKVKAILAHARLGMDITRNDFELRFLRFVESKRFPRPHTNQPIGPYEWDFVWREQRVVVELDGYGSHGTRRDFERDRAKDRYLSVRGWRVIRVTWRQFKTERSEVERDLRALLSSRSTNPRS